MNILWLIPWAITRPLCLFVYWCIAEPLLTFNAYCKHKALA